MEQFEYIACNGRNLALIIRTRMDPQETTFLTPNDFNFQLGFVVYPAGGEVTPHTHRPLERHIVGTSEVLMLRKGRCFVDIYDDDRKLVATRELHSGDVVLVVGGGHGYRMLENTTFLEIKQGPYTGLAEKEKFSVRSSDDLGSSEGNI
jgi:hypothetical protein